jgi:hypothetical protein
VTKRVPGGSGARRPRAREAARSTRRSSSPEVLSRQGVPSPAMSVKIFRPGAIGRAGAGEEAELGFRGTLEIARFGDSFGRV